MRAMALRSACLWLFICVLTPRAFAQIYHLRELNTEQIRALDLGKTVIILPGGILEEHGPYLPCHSDGYMNQRLTQELANAIVARPGWKALVFPTISLGPHGANIISRKYSFPGSYTLRMATLRAVFMDLATVLGEQGFRWVFIVHVHGAPEHNRALHQAGEFFRDTYGGHMVHLAGFMSVFSAFRGLLSKEETAEDGFTVHGGMEEHSVNLFLRADLVSPGYRQAPVVKGNDFAELVKQAHVEGWPGYFGSPRLASAAHGAQVWKKFSQAAISMALRILDEYDYRQEPLYAEVISADPVVAHVNRDALEHDRQIERRQTEWLRKKGFQ